MLETRTSELKTLRSENNIEDNITAVLLDDIKKSRYYKTRNRPTQILNPFFITNKGTFTAGILVANTPGDNKQE